ncbi:MAG: HAMP domain-containing histidine kinase [Burkholderiales bacterium]|nr:HAMP domain-containing histidine kinase [Burkholderiales bacterium]
MSAPTGAAARPALRWSYRLKVPLALSAVALAAGVAVAMTTYLLVYRFVEASATAQAQRLARTLARSLVQPVLANDVWQAFRTVRASALASGAEAAPDVQVLVLDAQGTVFVARDPRAFPLGTPAARLPPPLAAAARWVEEGHSGAEGYRDDDEARNSLVVAERLTGEEGAPVGGVIVQQERGIPRAQARAVAERLALLGSVAIVIVAVAGWAVGRRIIGPLEKLRRSMQAAPAEDVRPAVAEVSRLNDEVGDLGGAFLGMMDEIDAKRRLEREMLDAERMASIGRLTAGIAHEVNNPLGGMLSAIENRRLRGSLDEATTRTLALLERGLRQIHSTVNALLNEARRELHELSDDDVHDLYLLLHPEAVGAQCGLDWDVRVPAGGALPSVPVRQVILNLSLNAIAAAGRDGRVSVATDENADRWRLVVLNTGATLDPQALAALVRGDGGGHDGRTGLGVWVTARILHTLGGTLDLVPDAAARGFATGLSATFPFGHARPTA